MNAKMMKKCNRKARDVKQLKHIKCIVFCKYVLSLGSVPIKHFRQNVLLCVMYIYIHLYASWKNAISDENDNVAKISLVAPSVTHFYSSWPIFL